jgi:hypothetical protein
LWTRWVAFVRCLEVGVDDDVDVLGLVADLRELTGNGLLGGLLGELERQDLLHVLEVVARVVEDESVRVLDEDRVHRESHRITRIDVPMDVRLVDDERAAVEQVDLRIRHR